MRLSTSVLAGSARLALSIGLAVTIVVVSSAGLRFSRHGGAVLSVQTGSMRPMFRPGDAVIDWRARPGQLRVGDIVSYHSLVDPRVIVSHRIVAMHFANNGRLTLITKGDALARPDPAVSAQAVVGRVWAVAPGLGSFIGWLKTPIGLGLAVYLPAVVLIGGQARQLVGYYRPSGYRLY